MDFPEIDPGSANTLQRLEALNQAALTVSRELRLESVLQRIADTAREFSGSKYAALGIVGSDGVITSFITSGISQEEREKIGELPRGHGLLGVLIAQGQPLRVRDMRRDPRSSGFPPNHPPMTSLLGVPVSVGAQIVGDLYMTDKIGADEFTPADEWWVTLLARQAAVAIQNAHLYQTAQRERRRAKTLAELTGTLNNSVDKAALFQEITTAACQLLELPAAALYVVNEREHRFDLHAQVGLRVAAISDAALPMHGSIAGWVWANGKTCTVSDTRTLDNLYFSPLANNEYPRSIVVTPIIQEGRILGVIEAYGGQPRQFDSDEILLLEAFANQAALALKRAELYAQREEFLSMTAHDLRAPLTVIKMSAELLVASLPAELPAVLGRLASNISQNSDRLNGLLTDLLEMTRLEQGHVRLTQEQVELGHFIATTAATLAPLFEKKSQDLVFQRPSAAYYVQADPHRLEQVLVNVLSNAQKYTPDAGTVKVGLAGNDAWVTISVADTGPGIPLDEQTYIFDRYYRRPLHEQDKASSGSGLGLPIARSLIELHGGKIWVESSVGHGSTFFIRLPRAGAS